MRKGTPRLSFGDREPDVIVLITDCVSAKDSTILEYLDQMSVDFYQETPIASESMPARAPSPEAPGPSPDTTTYKIYWKWRGTRGDPTTVFAVLSDEQRRTISQSLKKLADYVEVPRFRIDEVDAELVSDSVLDYAAACKEIAKLVGVSALP